jgi:hypothetical protein
MLRVSRWCANEIMSKPPSAFTFTAINFYWVFVRVPEVRIDPMNNNEVATILDNFAYRQILQKHSYLGLHLKR